jgi:16S rRNA G966 N2-methylase RsmD
VAAQIIELQICRPIEGGRGGIISTPLGKSRDMAAEKAHVNSRYVSDAVTVKKESPELFEEMRSGLIHMKEAMSEVKKNRRDTEREKISDAGASVPISDRWHIYHGDINDITLDKQYDFIITDPPYPKEYLPLYGVLAKRAKEWLMTAYISMNRMIHMLRGHLFNCY